MTSKPESAAKVMAEEFAQSFVSAADLGVPAGSLDFSKESLRTLDTWLPELREGTLTAAERHQVALGAGAYLAEVIRRRSPVKLRGCRPR